jgi:hypothetical protein
LSKAPIYEKKKIKFAENKFKENILPEVGMDLPTPNNFLTGAFLKTLSALAANTATESLGVTKNLLPKIIFLSASPSHAAPKSGILLGKQLERLKTSIISTNYFA